MAGLSRHRLRARLMGRKTKDEKLECALAALSAIISYCETIDRPNVDKNTIAGIAKVGINGISPAS